MSELKTRFIDDTYAEYYNTGEHELAQIYLKSEADKVIADLEESHKKQGDCRLGGITQEGSRATADGDCGAESRLQGSLRTLADCKPHQELATCSDPSPQIQAVLGDGEVVRC